MHHREYLSSQKVVAHFDEVAVPGANHFYTLLMAAMREADTSNLEKLRTAFPDIYEELRLRYNAPGGALTREEYAWATAYFAEIEAGTAGGRLDIGGDS